MAKAIQPYAIRIISEKSVNPNKNRKSLGEIVHA